MSPPGVKAPEAPPSPLPSALFAIAAAIAFSDLAAFSLIKASLAQAVATACAPPAAFLPIATAVSFAYFTELPPTFTRPAQRFASALDSQNEPLAVFQALLRVRAQGRAGSRARADCREYGC